VADAFEWPECAVSEEFLAARAGAATAMSSMTSDRHGMGEAVVLKVNRMDVMIVYAPRRPRDGSCRMSSR
jgi:hypothetical protein